MAARNADTRPVLTGRAGARIVAIVVDPLARSWVVFHPPPGPGRRAGAGGQSPPIPPYSQGLIPRGVTMIELRDLHRSFGPVVAVDGISMSVGRGEVLGFLGPNGAGKSTTMKMITGFLAPTSGTAVVDGHDVRTASLAVRRVLGYLPEGAPAYPDMTPAGFLKWAAEIRGYRGAERARRVDAVVQRVQLESVLHQPIETLSKGFKRRVGLAQALLHDPAVLILDEPTDGLDPNQKHEVRNLIRALGSEKTVILSTHILEEVEAVCTRAVILAPGRIVADKTTAELHAVSMVHNAAPIGVRCV